VRILLPICLALGALSLLIPSAPTTDPWGWIVWGRELGDLRLDTAVGGVPSWKPLPVLFTSLFSLAGDAAPALWLVVARAGGMLAIVLAYRLGARLAGPVAGGIGALALLAIPGFLRGIAHGYADALVVAFALWAVERHLDGHRRQAFVLCFLAALGRPEAYVLLVAYGLVLWVGRPAARPLVATLLAEAPLLWLGGDWLGSGDPFHAGEVARVNLDSAGRPLWIELAGAPPELLGVPLAVLAAAAVFVGARRAERATLVLAAVAAAWIVLVLILAAAGYPAMRRFLIPPVALLCPLAGAGAVRVVEAARPRAARLAVAGVLVVAVAPSLHAHLDHDSRQLAEATTRARLQDDIPDAIQRAGGPARVLAHGRPVLPYGYGWNRGALAWWLDVPLRQVGGVRLHGTTPLRRFRPATALLEVAPSAGRRAPMVAAVKGHEVLFSPVAGPPPAVPGRPGLALRRLAVAGEWQVFAPVSRR
jgi:hypothetical protein